jgi:hypothetical protein
MAARPAFPGGASGLRENKGKRRRKKGVRWPADEWGLIVSGSDAG